MRLFSPHLQLYNMSFDKAEHILNHHITCIYNNNTNVLVSLTKFTLSNVVAHDIFSNHMTITFTLIIFFTCTLKESILSSFRQSTGRLFQMLHP